VDGPGDATQIIKAKTKSERGGKRRELVHREKQKKGDEAGGLVGSGGGPLTGSINKL